MSFIALGIVVRVDGAQRFVERVGEKVEVGRRFRELDEPLVAAFARRVHEYRCGGVLAHLGTRGLAGRFQSLLGIVHHELFAESVDKTPWCGR